MQVTILGKRFMLEFCSLPARVDGSCDAPDVARKRIRISKKLSGFLLLETLIHEFRHAADWSRDEEFVLAESRDLARMLWRLGYRRLDADEDSGR